MSSVKDFNKFREYKRKRSLSGSMSRSNSRSKSQSKSRKSSSKSRSRRSRVKSVRKQNLHNNKAFYAIVIILGLLLLAGISWLVWWSCSKDASSETEGKVILGKSKERAYNSRDSHGYSSRQPTRRPHNSYPRSRESESRWALAGNWFLRNWGNLLVGGFVIVAMGWMINMCVYDFFPKDVRAELEGKIDVLTTDNNDLTAQNQTCTEDKEECTSNLGTCTGDLDTCKTEKAALQTEFENWREVNLTKITQLTGEIGVLNGKIKAKNGNITTLKDQLSKHVDELYQMTLQVTGLEGQNASLNLDLAGSAAIVNNQLALIAEMEEQHMTALKDCEESHNLTTADLATCNAKLDAANGFHTLDFLGGMATMALLL